MLKRKRQKKNQTESIKKLDLSHMRFTIPLFQFRNNHFRRFRTNKKVLNFINTDLFSKQVYITISPYSISWTDMD